MDYSHTLEKVYKNIFTEEGKLRINKNLESENLVDLLYDIHNSSTSETQKKSSFAKENKE